MGAYIKLFKTHAEYKAYTASTAFVLPNVSFCENVQDEVHYNPYECEEGYVYEIVGTPSYPATIDGTDTSFDISFNYKRTYINKECQETVVNGSDTVTIECGQNPSTSDSRTVSGTVVWNDINIEYEVVQSKICPESTVCEIIGNPSYPASIDGASQSFDITLDYRRTDINKKCQQIVTTGTDTVTVEIGTNPSTSGSRTVTGTVDYYGNEIEYSIEQSKFEAKVVAKFNVTNTSSSTRIANKTSGFNSIEIDDVVQPSVVSAYTFDTLGEHTVKYTLVDPTSIGNNAFSVCSSLTSIDIPDSVTSIDNNAFSYCYSLSSCTIGNGVTSIGDKAFANCSGLTSIDIPDNVITIGSGMCEECISLTSATIGSGVTSIGDSTFAGCYNLTSIDIPDSVTSIGNWGFNYCSGLTSCTIGSGVTTIGDGTFFSATSLTNIDIPDGVTSIGYDAFNNCRSLSSCTIGRGVTSIGNTAFWGCINLTSINIPDSVTSIDYGAFRFCTNLTSCTIGNGVTSIGESAFTDCSGLSRITCNAMTAPTINNNTFQNVKTNGTLYVPQGSTGYDVWMGRGSYYLGKYKWTKVEQ